MREVFSSHLGCVQVVLQDCWPLDCLELVDSRSNSVFVHMRYLVIAAQQGQQVSRLAAGHDQDIAVAGEVLAQVMINAGRGVACWVDGSRR